MSLKKISIVFINLFIVGFLIFKIYTINSDKGVLLFLIYYPLIIILNLLFKLVSTEISVFQNQMVKALLIAFIPLLILVVEFL